METVLPPLFVSKCLINTESGESGLQPNFECQFLANLRHSLSILLMGVPPRPEDQIFLYLLGFFDPQFQKRIRFESGFDSFSCY